MQLQKYPRLSDSRLLYWLQVVIYSSVILYFGRDILVPLSFALLISCVLYPVCTWFERKGLGRMSAIVIAITLLIFIGLLMVALLINQFLIFLEEWPLLQQKLMASFNDISQLLEDVVGVSKDKQREIVTNLSDQSGTNLLKFIGNTLSASAFSAVMLVIIPVYVVLILYYRKYWLKILSRLFPTEREEGLREIIALTIKAYYNFIKGMALVYLIVGTLNSIGLLLLGVPHAILFGFIASILTFIPYIGIIVGSLLPITMAWITYDSIWYPVGIVAIFTVVQYLEANVIFPVAVSSRLNVNTLIMLLAIFVGGLLWGVTGMILFVPFVGIAKLIADHNPKWKTISMILGVDNSK
jgi:predicted PurR-regulated permease PerM